MLNSDSLAQLKSLKSQIKTTHEESLKEGIVRGSNGRFGFVRSDDGQSYFLPPDEMAKVFPGDSIRFSTKEDDKGKTQAIVEKLLSSDFKQFTGRLQKRGKAQFAVPDVHSLNNWLYLPPATCEGLEDDQWLLCEVTRHPYPSGKPQAKVIRPIGKLGEPGFERLYGIEKFQRSHEWLDTISSELALLSEDSIPKKAEGREDLTELPFVTIDSEHTRDMDDALFAAKTEQGWTLHIAIADPSAWFGMNTNLDEEASRRSNSLYFPGRSLPMLPQELSNGLCSLLEGKDRLGLICELQLSEVGEILSHQFKEALISSKAKLSYNQVTDFIGGKKEAISEDLQSHIEQLHLATQALNSHRQANCLVMEDRPDYYLNMTDGGKLQTITKVDRNAAQKLVEEAMLAANLSCARYLQEIGLGIYINHPGFRTERIGDIKTIIKDQNIAYEGDFTQPEEYKKLIKVLDDSESELPLKTILSRFLTRSEFSKEAQAHQGMGFDCYTTFTSPIRKYSDLVIHRIIKAHLKEQKLPEVSDQLIQDLQDNLIQGRSAVGLSEHWLKIQFLASQKATEFDGVIVQTNPAGCTVQITDFGVDGFVEINKKKSSFEFDRTYLRHVGKGKNEGVTYQLDQPVKVSIKNIDLMQRKLELEFVS